MDIDSDFKSQLYNLQGIHINERKKNFYKLLKSTSQDVPQDQFDIQPRNYLERIFYVEVLIYFKQVEKLMEILKEGIGVLTSHILKQRWFFQEAFKNMSEENIVNDFLPKLCYSLRMKVLKKMSLTLSEERMDNIFDFVLERYGLFIAKQFLFSCSPTKIINVLKNNEVILLPEQLKRLLQKNIEVLKVYFEEYKRNMKKEFQDSAFLNYLAWKRPDLYFELGLDSKDDIKLGYRTTRAVMKTNKENIFKVIKNSRWNKTALVKEVKDFDKKYLFLFFPDDFKSVSDFYYVLSVENFVKKYPVKKQWEVLSLAFNHAYKKEIVDYIDKFPEAFVKFFPRKIQKKWAEIKYFETDDLQYIKYFKPEKAFKLLKDKINVTSNINQRSKLLHKLISVCHQNRDYSTYEAVLKYICLRHRNDEKYVRANIVTYIKDNIEYHLLTEAHWKYINEIISLQRIRGENVSFDIMSEYLLFDSLRKHHFDEPVVQYIKDCVKANKSFRFFPLDKEKERNILKQIIKILPTLQLENHVKVTHDLLSGIIDFHEEIKNDKVLNKNFKDLRIDLSECTSIINLFKTVCIKKGPYNDNDYDVVKKLVLYNYLYSEHPVKVIDEDNLLDIVITMCGDENRGEQFNDCFVEIIKKSHRTKFENTLLDYYFNNTNEKHYYFKYNAIGHFLAKEPEVIEKYFSQILSLDVKYGAIMINYDIIKMYSHLNLDKQLISYFKDVVLSSFQYDKKVKLLDALSKVMDTTDFLDLVKEYTASALKFCPENKRQKKLYRLQCDVTKICKKLDRPLAIMNSPQADYLHSSLPALYSVLYRINEEKANSCIHVLGKRTISTRKHVISLGFKLLAFKDAITLYLVLTNEETNISAKKHQFQALLKYFLKNPSKFVLKVIFREMECIDKNDSELIQIVVRSVNRVSNRNKPLFTEKVWNFLDILERQEVNVFDYRNQILNTVYRHGVSFVGRLKQNFCENLIDKYFLTRVLSTTILYDNSNPLNSFVINYLMTYLDEEHFEFVFNVIKRYKDIHWGLNSDVKMKFIFGFFDYAYGEFDQNDIKFLSLFKKFWHHVFSLEETFSEYTLLGIMVLYKENSNMEEFSKKASSFFQELLEKYGYISNILVRSINIFFQKIRRNTDFIIQNFAFNLLKSNCSEFNCFAAYNIIKESGSEDDHEIYSKTLNILQSVNQGSVRIYCNILSKRI